MAAKVGSRGQLYALKIGKINKSPLGVYNFQRVKNMAFIEPYNDQIIKD